MSLYQGKEGQAQNTEFVVTLVYCQTKCKLS